MIMCAFSLDLSTVFRQRLLDDSILGREPQQHSLLSIYMSFTNARTPARPILLTSTKGINQIKPDNQRRLNHPTPLTEVAFHDRTWVVIIYASMNHSTPNRRPSSNSADPENKRVDRSINDESQPMHLSTTLPVLVMGP